MHLLEVYFYWIFAIQGVSYLAKLAIHPAPLRSLDELWARAAVGPVSGQAVLLIGMLFHAGLVLLAVVTLRQQQAVGRVGRSEGDEHPMLRLGI